MAQPFDEEPMEVSADGNTFVLRPKAASYVPPPAAPRYTAPDVLRHQHARLQHHVNQMAGMIQRVCELESSHPTMGGASVFLELESAAAEARRFLTNLQEAEHRARHDAEDARIEVTAPDPHWRETRPVTQDPVALVLLDYVDNLRNDAMAACATLVALVNHDDQPNTEAGRWVRYDRLSALFLHLGDVDRALDGASDLAREWGVDDLLVEDWIKTARKVMQRQQEVLRGKLAETRG